MKILVPSALYSYTKRADVEAIGDHLNAVLMDLDARYPGIRFRIINEQEKIRPHVRFFLNGEPVRDLGQSVTPMDELIIVQALSGG